MNPFDFNPSLRWLFCMTHPDDEISVCQFIRQLVAAGNEVFILWTHSIPVREEEGRASAELLGVPQDRLWFLQGVDGNIAKEIHLLEPRMRAIFDEIKPDRVVCGAFEQGHIDHDATNFLVNLCFSGPVYEAPFYHTYTRRLQTINRFSDPRGEFVLELEPEAIRFKKDFAKRYPSQNIWSVLLAYEAVRIASKSKRRLAYSERLRLQNHKDFETPNHPPRIQREVTKSQKWKEWLEALNAYRSNRPA